MIRMWRLLLLGILGLLMALMFPGGALGHRVTATFTYANPAVDGFKFYDNGVFLCQVVDPTARTITCEAELGFGAHAFTLTAYAGDEESIHSIAYPLMIGLLAPSLGSVTVEDGN